MSIAHEPNRFVLHADGHTAHLDYELAGKVITITHTIVPEPLGGRGIAAQLAKAAFDYARAADLKIIPACSYVAAWAKKHAEAKDLLA
jgi:uncharacterized protein